MTTETKTPHYHAALMAQYAADAAETDTPWERWQIKLAGEAVWVDAACTPGWTQGFEYRRKPASSAVPEPEPKPTANEPQANRLRWLRELQREYREKGD